MLVVIVGLPGTGKTTFAKALEKKARSSPFKQRHY